ncbi:hypothetical protein D3C86_2206040 [compost metagenome]
MVGWPGRTQPTVELDVPKSTPQAMAMSLFQCVEGAVVYQKPPGPATAPRHHYCCAEIATLGCQIIANYCHEVRP